MIFIFFTRMNRRGFTLVELIIAVAALCILALIAVPLITGVVERARAAADAANLSELNKATYRYAVESPVCGADIFTGLENDAARMDMLVASGFLPSLVSCKQRDMSFRWSVETQEWQLSGASESINGGGFAEVSSGIIAAMQKRLADTGYYGRSWGDYRNTDIGLDPADWKEPVDHIYYIPNGSNLLITPEAGYTFVVLGVSGETRRLPASYNWNLVYSDTAGKWYYHYIGDENEIDIGTLKVEKS